MTPVLSGTQPAMPKACETILVPGPQLAGEALLQLADQAGSK
jgi:hypothetical protein